MTNEIASYVPRSNVLMLFFGAAITAILGLGVSYIDRTVSDVNTTARSLAILQSETSIKVQHLQSTINTLNTSLERGYTVSAAIADFALRDERIRQLSTHLNAVEERLIHVERLLITRLRKQALEDDANDATR